MAISPTEGGNVIETDPDNYYWHCPFRKDKPDCWAWCDWPCDEWAQWHDSKTTNESRKEVYNAIGEFLNARRDDLMAQLKCHNENTEGWRSTHQRLYELDEIYEWLDKQTANIR